MSEGSEGVPIPVGEVDANVATSDNNPTINLPDLRARLAQAQPVNPEELQGEKPPEKPKIEVNKFGELVKPKE